MQFKKILGHSLIQNTFFLSLIKALDLILPLMTIPYLTRVLSIEQFGALVICMATYSMANIFTDFGFGLSAPYEISKNKSDKYFINSYVSAIFILKLMLSIAVILLVIPYFYYGKASHVVDFIGISLVAGIILCLAFQAQWFFLGVEKMKSITILASLGKISYFAMVFIIVPFYKSLNSVLVCIFLSNAITVLFYFIFIKNERYIFTFVSSSLLRKVFFDSLSFFISRLAVGLSTTANGIVIGSILGAHTAALYGAAEKIYNAGISLVMPVSNALYPYMARTKNHKLLIKVIFFFTLSSIIGCYLISYITPWFFEFFFGKDYIYSSYLFNFFLILVPINIASIFFGYTAFATVNKPKIANYTVIVSSFIYLLAFLFIYYKGNFSVVNIIILVIMIDSLTLILRMFLFFKELHKFDKD
ncbi:oligosaccharide flippase family protein [Citrobacter braakii]|uniref:oligosaccharide flippase family protein n=1 Tax=Citrobacter braakii TaxID=57706 RepID=UPI00159639F5|nr:oligosaccharide flippase family protein [Citrobacter braakii]MCY9797024.1 oligosaccharide flippase family protein [Citrobacter braakii]MDL4385188.1 oligosaccharide flippase family protein [Citrobacter braakii]